MSEKCLDFDFFWFVFSRNQTEYVFSPNVSNYGTEKLTVTTQYLISLELFVSTMVMEIA